MLVIDRRLLWRYHDYAWTTERLFIGTATSGPILVPIYRELDDRAPGLGLSRLLQRTPATAISSPGADSLRFRMNLNGKTHAWDQC